MPPAKALSSIKPSKSIKATSPFLSARFSATLTVFLCPSARRFTSFSTSASVTFAKGFLSFILAKSAAGTSGIISSFKENSKSLPSSKTFISTSGRIAGDIFFSAYKSLIEALRTSSSTSAKALLPYLALTTAAGTFPGRKPSTFTFEPSSLSLASYCSVIFFASTTMSYSLFNFSFFFSVIFILLNLKL